MARRNVPRYYLGKLLSLLTRYRRVTQHYVYLCRDLGNMGIHALLDEAATLSLSTIA